MMNRFACIATFTISIAFLLGVAVQPAKADMSDVARACTWDFGRNDGFVIAPRIRLAPRGVIDGYSHPNEDSWGIEDGDIVFYNESGRILTRFNQATVIDGKLTLYGRFLGGGDITHTLTCR